MGKRKKLKKISRSAKKTFRVINSLDNIADKFIPLNQKVDNHKISDTGTEEIKLINQHKRTIKQAVRTEASLIRLRILLIKRLLRIRKKRKYHLKLKKTKGKYTIAKKEYKVAKKNKDTKRRYFLKRKTKKTTSNSKSQKPRIVPKNKKRKYQLKSNSNHKLRTVAKNAISEISKLSSEVLSQQSQTDKNNITDTGAESVKLINSAVHTGKSGIKTVKQTIKITKSTIKTIKNTPKNIKRAAKTTYKATKTAIRVVKATINIATKAISHIVAAVGNPAVLITLAVVIVILYITIACITVLGGATAGEAQTMRAYKEAAGLKDVPEEFKKGLDLLQKRKDEKKKQYEAWIDALYFSNEEDKLKHSDLVYLKRFDKLNNITEYTKGLASSDQKSLLKNAFDWNLGISDVEMLSIAYVLAEKEKNISEDTEYVIAEIEYTKELIDKVLNAVVKYYDSHTYTDQECPGSKCSKKRDSNPEKEKARYAQEKLINGYKGWVYEIIPLLKEHSRLPGSAQKQYWELNIQWRIDNWIIVYSKDVYGEYYPNTKNNGVTFSETLYDAYSAWWDYWVSLPDYIETYICEHKHKLYSKGLEFYNKENVMAILGFNDTDIYWVYLTETYLETTTSEIITEKEGET